MPTKGEDGVASAQDRKEGAGAARARWLALLYAATPADRAAAEQGARDLYRAANREPPRRLIWLDSPAECCGCALLLNARRDPFMRRIIEALEKNRQAREQLQLVRAKAAQGAGGAAWDKIAEDAGGPLFGMGADPSRSFFLPMMEARDALWGDLGRAMGDLARDGLYAAQTGLYKLFGRSLHGGGDTLVGSAVSLAYHFLWMEMDEQKAAESRAPPAFLEAAWRVARAAGPWWAYDGLALLSERPSEMHRNAAGLPERGDGPAIAYRSGLRIYAWNGQPYPEKWIEHPETIPSSQLKHADKSFRDYLSRRLGPEPRAKIAKAAKPSALLKAKLPAEAAERLQYLRKHAGGKLPLYDRYLAGAHQDVWRELQAQGAPVRSDPLLANALAVAHETMRRVEANVRTLVARLLAIGYRFKTEASAWQEREGALKAALNLDVQLALPPDAPPQVRDVLGRLKEGGSLDEIALRSPHVRDVLGRLNEARTQLQGVLETARAVPRDDSIHPHDPPPADTAKLLARLEKKAGPLPLSLRVFYEVVGSVDFMGSHPSLAPPKGSICPDPLVIFPLEDVLADLDEMDGDDDDICLMLAPDEFHKAGQSGGEPYEMATPDARADGELLNERHELPFVDYLRLAFRFGGFPGYEGQDPLPPEIETLRAGLLEF